MLVPFLAVIMLFCLSIESFAEVNVTIYNQNVALVRETRELDFPAGEGEVRFTDVAARIIPSSVHFNCTSAELIEQNFEFDLIDADKLTSRFLDQTIEIIDIEGEAYKGTLLSADNGYVLEEKNGSVRLVSKDQMANIRFPKLPEGLMTRPTLVWSVNSETLGKAAAEISYLTFGMDWETEYVAVVNEDLSAVHFTGWANIENFSGATFRDAKLKLMAGDVKMQTREQRYSRNAEFKITGSGSVSRGFQESSFHEYHLYELQQPSTLNDNQRKQVALFQPSDVVKVKKELKMNWGTRRGTADVRFTFDNTEENGLGLPLPQGIVRVYKEAADGNQEFIGEDRIKHTPRNESFTITTGKAFDIAGERKVLESKHYYRMNYEEIDDYISEEVKEVFKDTINQARYEKVQMKVRNHKSETAEVLVHEHFPKRRIIESCKPRWTEKDLHNLKWVLVLEPEEEAVITYEVIRN